MWPQSDLSGSLGGPQSQFGHYGEGIIFLPLPEIEPCVLPSVA